MPTEKDLQNFFTDHAATPEQKEAHRLIREQALALAKVIREQCQDSDDADRAIRRVIEAFMIANQSIACHQQGKAAGGGR